MLVLTREPQESIMIGNDIVITVLHVHGRQVKIGISAPDDVAINREEIHLKIVQGIPRPNKIGVPVLNKRAREISYCTPFKPAHDYLGE